MKKRHAGNREPEDKIISWLSPLIIGFGFPLAVAQFDSNSVHRTVLGVIIAFCVFPITNLSEKYLQLRKARRLARDGEHNAL